MMFLDINLKNKLIKVIKDKYIKQLELKIDYKKYIKFFVKHIISLSHLFKKNLYKH